MMYLLLYKKYVIDVKDIIINYFRIIVLKYEYSVILIKYSLYIYIYIRISFDSNVSGFGFDFFSDSGGVCRNLAHSPAQSAMVSNPLTSA